MNVLFNLLYTAMRILYTSSWLYKKSSKVICCSGQLKMNQVLVK